MSLTCWCGETALTRFSSTYHRCPRCRTLVCELRPESRDPADPESHYYGKDYWFTHQTGRLGLPDITARAAMDLPERCAFWLRELLRLKLPPAQVLEIGCAHGGFTALAEAAGFTAAGIELSPAIADFGRKAFEVMIFTGPVEDHGFAPGSLDCVCLFDVLEHLEHPQDTLAHCAGLLKPDGILLVQTPKYPEHASLSDLENAAHPFLKMMQEEEHLHLFSAHAAEELMHRLGLRHVVFRPALFPHYDMFFAASRREIVPVDADLAQESLRVSPAARFAGALIDGLENNEAAAAVIARQDETIKTLNKSAEALRTLSRSRVFKFMRRLGPWSWIDKGLVEPDAGAAAAESGKTVLDSVGVDLIPLLPGGENGGAKIVALSLIDSLAKAHPGCMFTLFTSDKAHDEIAWLDRDNVRRVLTVRTASGSGDKGLPIAKLAALAGRLRGVPVSGRTLWRIKALLWKIWTAGNHKRGALAEHKIKALLCPFTLPFVYDPDVPTLSVVHDLQYLYYPQFFSVTQQFERERNFRQAVALADRIVCVSDYVRGTVLEKSEATPDRVGFIHTRLATRLPSPDPDSLRRLGLEAGGYLFFPANAWAHKNHRMLFTALGMFFAEHPQSKLKLVLTGADNDAMAALKAEIKAMGLAPRILFAGFLPEPDFAAVLDQCLALVFPSLYEGFGMPVLEAMAHGKPVLCSAATSLPEIAGDAAVFFDPNKPADIKDAIARLAANPELAARLARKGRDRARGFGDVEDMAREYWEELEKTAKTRGGSE